MELGWDCDGKMLDICFGPMSRRQQQTSTARKLNKFPSFRFLFTCHLSLMKWFPQKKKNFFLSLQVSVSICLIKSFRRSFADTNMMCINSKFSLFVCFASAPAAPAVAGCYWWRGDGGTYRFSQPLLRQAIVIELLKRKLINGNAIHTQIQIQMPVCGTARSTAHK